MPCIVVVSMELVACLVAMTEPCEDLEMMAILVVVALVVVVRVLEESIATQVVVVKVLGELVFQCIFVVVIIFDRQFVVPISFGIPTIVLISLVVWRKELVVVGIVVDNSWACQVDLECVVYFR